MKAFLRIDVELNATSREEAECLRDEILGEFQDPELVVGEVKHDLAIVGGEPQLVLGIGVAHPWDQGLNIFPDDHPYAEYERMAKKYDAAKMKDHMYELGVGHKMLPPSDEVKDD
jgi:hypothetical protein